MERVFFRESYKRISESRGGPVGRRTRDGEPVTIPKGMALRRTLLKSKIHRATVTAADLHYEGSVTVDVELMEAADLCPHERVDIYNITTGTRLSTYVLPGEPGSGEIQINGAAAHLVQPGELVILASFAEYEEDEIVGHIPRVVLVDESNRPVDATTVSSTEAP